MNWVDRNATTQSVKHLTDIYAQIDAEKQRQNRKTKLMFLGTLLLIAGFLALAAL